MRGSQCNSCSYGGEKLGDYQRIISEKLWKIFRDKDRTGRRLPHFYGENEFGKSTLHAFIRSMLFGLTKGRGRAAKNDLFTKYEPWDQPSYYAGEMTFESGDRTFIISRRFDRYGKSASLVCQTDGEDLIRWNRESMDMLLDGMSEAAFENTISIGQTKQRQVPILVQNCETMLQIITVPGTVRWMWSARLRF